MNTIEQIEIKLVKGELTKEDLFWLINQTKRVDILEKELQNLKKESKMARAFMNSYR